MIGLRVKFVGPYWEDNVGVEMPGVGEIIHVGNVVGTDKNAAVVVVVKMDYGPLLSTLVDALQVCEDRP